jgi:hypothetical protein
MRSKLSAAIGVVAACAASIAVAQTAPATSPAEETTAPPAATQPTVEATPATAAPAATPAPAASDATAEAQGKIILYRPSSIMGMGIACPIRYEGKEIVELARGKYAEWPVNAGHYVLTNKTSSVEVAVNPGETRYVRCVIKPGFLTGRADLQIADEASFSEHSKDFEKKPIE